MAETRGSQYLERPLHIGKLSFRLWTGRFLLDDVVIEGFTAESRPWLKAQHIEVTLAWSTLFHKQVVLDSIEMTDWQIYLEMLASGKHNLPKLTPKPSDRKSGWTTTLRWVRAHRGAFTYEDHGTPWSIVTRNVDIIVAKPGSEYRGEARFTNGTIAIQDYVPFGAEVDSTFKIDGSRILFDKIALASDGAKSMVTGDVNMKFFPEMMFRVESTMDFKRMRELFFAHEAFKLAGTGRFEGYFHLYKERRPGGTSGTGREVFGTFASAQAGVKAGVNDYRFDNLRGSVRWTARRLTVTDASADLYGGRARFGYEMSPLGVRDTRATARFSATMADLSLQRLFDFYEVNGMRLAGGLSGTLALKWPLGQFSAGYQLTSALHVTPPPGVTIDDRAAAGGAHRAGAAAARPRGAARAAHPRTGWRRFGSRWTRARSACRRASSPRSEPSSASRAIRRREASGSNPVSREQRRLAGELPDVCRDADRPRLADLDD